VQDTLVFERFHKLVEWSQDALFGWHGEGGVLEPAEQRAKVAEGKPFSGYGRGECVEELGDLRIGQFHRLKDPVEDPAKDLFAYCPDAVASKELLVGDGVILGTETEWMP
jgi:hypothetical protein